MPLDAAVFSTTRENTNYARLCRLLVDVGSQALRDTFDRYHPPAHLHKDLSKAKPILQSLREQGILNPNQWGTLYPAIRSSVSSCRFDITLLVVLCRNICHLRPPTSTGDWDKPPRRYDKSIAADIARIKCYRNEVYGHAVKASLDDASFDRLWQDIRNALLRLGSGTTYASVISRLKTECMDSDYEEYYKELLHKWKKDDDSTKEKVEELKELVTSKVGELTELVTSKVGELTELVTSKVGELTELVTSKVGESAGDSGEKATRTPFVLKMAHNRICDQGAVSLAKAIETDGRLETLDASHSKIGDKGAAAVAKALETNSTLTELNLSHNEIGDSGATALAKAMDTNSALTKLNLSGNKIGDSGAIALAEAIETNLTLTELDMSGNKIGESGAAAIAKALERKL